MTFEEVEKNIKKIVEILRKLDEKYCKPEALTADEAEEKAKTHWVAHIDFELSGTPRTFYAGKLYYYNGKRIQERHNPAFMRNKYRVVCPQEFETKPVDFWELQKHNGEAVSAHDKKHLFGGGRLKNDDRLEGSEVNNKWTIQELLPPKEK